MLRRRLLMVIGPMLTLLVLTGIVGIILLQNTLGQFQEINQGGLATVEAGNDFLGYLRDIRRNFHEMAIGHPNQLEQMHDSLAQATQLLHDIEQSPFAHHPQFNSTLDHIHVWFPLVQEQVADISKPNAVVTPARAEALIEMMNQSNADVDKLNQLVRDQAAAEFQDLSNTFRWQLIGLSIVAIVVINFSIISLLKMVSMVLRPMDKLVAATRAVAQQKFDVRVELQSDDEFGQLAQAYNHMAAELGASEQRRMEVLGQVAVTMNHELNNVINIIELQLTLVSKRTETSGALEGHLKQIRESLGRMTRIVDELRHARRIVLTEYNGGMKMIDLRRSAQPVDAAEQTIPAHAVVEPHL